MSVYTYTKISTVITVHHTHEMSHIYREYASVIPVASVGLMAWDWRC